LSKLHADIDPQELILLNRSGQSYAELAIKFNTTRGTIAGIISRTKDTETSKKFDVAYHPIPFQLSGDFMVVGDIHVPTTDYQLARLVARVAEKHLNNPRLIIAGDFFNLDAFSHYPAVVPSYSWREEREAGAELFSLWLKTFSEIYVIMGNHDRRIQKWSQAQLEETDIFGMVVNSSKVKLSNLGWLTVETPGGLYRVTHSRNYSINQLTVADQLAQKFGCSIISHHEHHLAIGWDRYKHHIIVNNGGLFDPKQLIYTLLDDNKSANMAQGFTMLKNGTPTLFGNSPFTDWQMWV
jgi:hypothetical protein